MKMQFTLAHDFLDYLSAPHAPDYDYELQAERISDMVDRDDNRVQWFRIPSMWD